MKGEYYSRGLLLANTSGPAWLTVTNLAVLQNGTNADIVTSVVGNAFLPQAPESYLYDLDGNLTNDGRWQYTWDAENRLVAMTNHADIPPEARRALTFVYDHQGRRTQKIVYTNDGSGYVAWYTNRFVYDGWNLIAILHSDFSLLTSFTWGTDLSGTMQGAGGVGGLLAITDYRPGTAGTYFPAYDGNGNVVALVNAADGSIAAQYEYGPFGEVIRATGPMARANPFRFSTKYQDDETDLLYYGYRYYDPTTGRWLSRDAMGEVGSMNLFVFTQNNPASRLDPLGLQAFGPWDPGPIILPVPFPGNPLPPPPPSPQLMVATTWYGSCRNCPVADAATAIVNSIIRKGKCREWFAEHNGLDGYQFVLMCRSSCNPASWIHTTWTSPGPGISLARNKCDKLGAIELASLLIHEIAHHYCPPIGFGGEKCANSAQDACGDQLTNY